MDAALQAFLVTIAIMGGILSPFILLAILALMAQSMGALGAKLTATAENMKRQPPFDDVEVNVNPATRVMTMRFIKNGVSIWQGSASQNSLDDKLEIKADD
mgnify:FL=1